MERSKPIHSVPQSDRDPIKTRRFYKKMSWSNHAETSSSSELTTMDETAACCLMLLSKVGELKEKYFDCKTCGKTFLSFQALGGHRASHKKPKLDQDQSSKQSIPARPRPRSHKCTICGAEFALGQALGGHMRRHRDSIAASKQQSGAETDTTAEVHPVRMRSNSKRVRLDLNLNLNLTPPGEIDFPQVESDLKLQLGKRDYEMKMELGMPLQEYDLGMQTGKRRRFGDGFLGLVAL